MPSHLMTLVAAVCLMLLAAPVHGWWCNGHMLVAMVAQRHLKPGVSEKVEEITARLSTKGPFPKIPDFVQLACWADDIKAEKMNAMGGWHYIDVPYNPENVTIAKWPVEDKNVLTIIEDMVSTLKKGEASPYTVEFALANLVHSYGDIHMPLHNMEFFSPEYPKGDMGGNRITVFMGEHAMKLHALWDSMCQGPQEDPPRSLSKENYDKVRKFADYLEESYQFTDAQKAEMDPAVFSRESYEFGVMATYNGVVNGTKLPDAYITRCRWITEVRVALAGYRLATVLNSLFA